VAFIVVVFVLGFVDVLPVHAVSNRIYMVPNVNTFETRDDLVCHKWNVTIYVEDISPNLWAFQVNFTVDDTLLNITGAWLPVWDPGYVFYSKISMTPLPAFYDKDADGSREAVLVGDLLIAPESAVTGSGKLAIIELHIIAAPAPGQTLSCTLGINNEGTLLQDDTLAILPATKEDGSYSYTRIAGDIAVIGVKPNVDHQYPGRTVDINVTVINYGNLSETNFNVTAYNGTAQIGKIPIPSLGPGENKTVVFHWNTTGLPPCNNYTISANATIFPWDSNATNNELIDGTVHIAMLGDVNGDGGINILDLVMAAGALGAKPGDSNWNPHADIYANDYVDIFDLVMIVLRFGKYY